MTDPKALRALVEELRERIIAAAFADRRLLDGMLADRLISERYKAANAIEALLDAAEGEVVRVKPLEWAEPSKTSNGCWTAESPFGTYSVVNEGGWWCILEGAPYCKGFEWLGENAAKDTVATAKAAAQADYESRIRSALASPVEGWRPGPPPADCGYVDVREVTTYRYLPYKPDGRRQMRAPGRWQRATEHGFENCAPPTGEWRPTLRLSAAPLPQKGKADEAQEAGS